MGAGDDVVYGAAGNDLINGRSGTDQALLTARQSDYLVVVWDGEVGTVPRDRRALAAVALTRRLGIETAGLITATARC